MLITLSSHTEDFWNSDHDGPECETARFQRLVDQRTRGSDDRTTSEATGIARSNHVTSRMRKSSVVDRKSTLIDFRNRNSMVRIQRSCDQWKIHSDSAAADDPWCYRRSILIRPLPISLITARRQV
ncbi:hypothetical protein ABTX81_06760 [Kitasatospora sp. NPDC097605]|uniref:hypothetical protein n=1 Tax=Kitasatospora sp. NPDC097605 TaxID=3157226 RepID=UPI003324250F